MIFLFLAVAFGDKTLDTHYPTSMKKQPKISQSSTTTSINGKKYSPKSEISGETLLLDSSQCEPNDGNYNSANENGGMMFGNVYACDISFKGSFDGYGILHMYSCRFNEFSSVALSVSIDSNIEGDVIIKGSQFTSCKEGAISFTIFNYDKEKYPGLFSVTECIFEQCQRDSGAAIYFNAARGEIKQCQFINNNEFDGGDIYFEYYAAGTQTEEKLVIDKCTFERKNGASAKGSFLYFTADAKFDFTNNQVNVQSQISKEFKVFNWPSGLENTDGLLIKDNKMNPYREDILDNFKGSISDSFKEEEPMKCPPIPLIYGDLPSSIYMHDCEGNYNSGEPDDRGFYSNTLCGLYFSTFYNLQLMDDSFGAAIYITTSKNTEKYKEPVKIYKCGFSQCYADVGGAVYIQSTETNRLFDINGSTFTQNTYNNLGDLDNKMGGAIYIKAPQSCARIVDCTFDSNICGNGGAIYYIQDDLEPSTTSILDNNQYALYVGDCRFQNNDGQSNGGAIYIKITNTQSLKPIEINNCEFVQNKADHRDAEGSNPEDEERGGAIYFSFESTNDQNFVFTITGCNFKTNTVTYYGGAIFLSLTKDHKSLQININHCTFDGNKADNAVEGNSDHGSGADIYYTIDSDSTGTSTESPSFVIDQCEFANSESFLEGGSITLNIQNDAILRKIQIIGCTFDLNNAQNGGSIMISQQSKSSSNSIEINSCTFNFIDNKVEYGGAIYYKHSALSSSKNLLAATSASECSLYVKNCTFSNYRMKSCGGAFYISIENEPDKPIEINNCTFNGREGYDPDPEEENGGAIYYTYTSSSSTELLEAREGDTSYIFSVIDSIFKSNEGCYGGSIYISIQNAKQPKNIEIVGCSFNEDQATNYDFNDTPKGYGGSIYYSTNSASVLNSLLVNNCNFINAQAMTDGGSIYLSIQNDNYIEINDCVFNGCTASNNAGGSIYYNYKPSSQFVAEPGLKITKCEFSSCSSNSYGGAIYLSAMECKPAKSVEISYCSFSDSYSNTNKDSLYIQSKEKINDLFYITGCNFSQYTVLIDCYSAKFEKCKFDDVSKEGKYALYIYCTLSATANDYNYVITVDQCNFSQTTDVDALVFFEQTIKSKFSFTNNRIEINQDTIKTRVLGCDIDMTTDLNFDKYWNFENNYINPPDRDRIKDFTSFSAKIPADCGSGFLCEIPESSTTEETSSTTEETSSTTEETSSTTEETSSTTEETSSTTEETSTTTEETSSTTEETSSTTEETSSTTEETSSTTEETSTTTEELPDQGNCEENNRCDMDDDNSGSSINLTDRNYQYFNNTDYGAAIRLINHCLICQNSRFHQCRVNIGGGAIYIVVNKTQMQAQEILLEGLTFTECSAIYGGAVYIYNDLDFQVKILSCIFEQNTAQRKAPEGQDKNLYGGAAVYLQVRDGNVSNCSFHRNVGCGLKIYNKFKDSSSSSSRLLNKENQLSVSISDCFFEIDKLSSSSLFYARDNKDEIPVKVKDCVFTGELANDAHHIDGSLSSEINEKSNLRIESCKFSSGMDKAVNLKKYPLLFASFDNEMQQFNYVDNGEKKMKAVNNNERNQRVNLSLNVVVIAALSVLAILAAILAIFIIKRINKSSEDIMDIEDIFDLNKNEL